MRINGMRSKKLSEFIAGDDLDFYEQFTIYLTDEDQEQFFADNPDFMMEFPISRDKMYLLKDVVFRGVLRRIKEYEGGKDMALIKCPNCGKEISDKATICPECKIVIYEFLLKKKEEELNREYELKFEQQKKILEKKYHSTNSNKGKNVCLLVICIICVISLIGNCVQFLFSRTQDTKNPSSVVVEEDNTEEIITDDSTQSDSEIDTSGAMLSFLFVDEKLLKDCMKEGVYKCGTDFEPGEYVVCGLVDQGNVNVFSDLSSQDSANYQSGIMFEIDLSDGQYIEIQTGTVVIPKSSVDMSDLKQYGIFQVGKDIPAGEYKIDAITNEYSTSLASLTGSFGGYEICEGDPLNGSTIVSESLFDEQKYIELKENQYLKIVDAGLYKVD